MEMDEDDQESERPLQMENEGNMETDIKGAIEQKDKNTSEEQCHVQESTELPRRSERSRIPTEKMLAYQKEECRKKEKKINYIV